MDRKQIIQEMRERCSNNSIALPKIIDFLVDNRCLFITLHCPDKNMQDNAACFESWILILKRWLAIDKVEMDWASSSSSSLHYHRFLYRVMMFQKAFASWFSVTASKVAEVDSFKARIGSSKLILNIPICDADDTKDLNTEHGIECTFADSSVPNPLLNIVNCSKLYTQLPVGVFENKVSQKTRLFNSGSGALDLWGINGNSELVIFELKYKNIMAGIITELLFYLYIMHGACVQSPPTFSFDQSKKAFRGIDNLIGKKYKGIKGYFLSDRLHPLIDDGLIELINQGLSNIGPITVATIEYQIKDNQISYD